MGRLKIFFDGCSIDSGYEGLNNINNAFLHIDFLDLYTKDFIDVENKTRFIPGKIIVFLGYYLDILNTKNKNVNLIGHTEFINFTTKCGLLDFVNNQKINYNLLNDSVVIPFCKVPSSELLEEHFLKLINRNNFKEENINLIMQFLGELQNNSKIHGKTNNIYIMGQYYPNLKKYDISIYDDGEGIQTNNKDFIKQVYKNFVNEDFYTKLEKKFGFHIFFIILCVSTRFSTKGKNIGGLGLYDLSSFLYKNKGYLEIATGKEYINLKFNNICDILDNNSLEIINKKLDNKIKGTYISFTFLQ